MKKLINKSSLVMLAVLSLTACNKLDLDPLSESSTNTFYDTQTGLELAVNDLYRANFMRNDNELFTDNTWHRAQLGNAVTYGTMVADDATANTYWVDCYKAIARVNSFLANKDKAASNTPASVIVALEAEMRLIRAWQYGLLVTHYGDVPLLTSPTELSEAAGITRKSKEEILTFVFSELDFAASKLPSTYAASAVKRLTKGAAIAIKSRIALNAGKYAVARDAAKAIIDMGANVYSLHPSYQQLFLKAGESSKEIIFSLPRDQAQGVFNAAAYVQDWISRNAGGFGAWIPTREIVDSYECTDGKPIDESPLYNPRDPFKNRDPRMTATVVEFGIQWLGYGYMPHPDSTTVWSSKLGRRVQNNDTRGVANFASFTGFLYRKGIDQTWPDRLAEDNDAILFRYAESLLTYAEAKIELNEIDASVLNAINQVRARAYGVPVAQVASYPAITTTSQIELRKIVRRERRVEFVNEGLRYMDLIRWRLAEKALTRPAIGLPDPAAQNRSKWPFPGITPIDDDGIADYSGFGTDVKILAPRAFDKTKQYLWPIPNLDRIVNPNLTQNPGY